MVPAWISPQQWQALNPPAEVLQLGEMPRAPDVLLQATRVLKVKEARRYSPVRAQNGSLITWCNIYLSDVLAILAAPIPHLWEDHELRANDIVDDLRAGALPGWNVSLGALGAAAAAGQGLPTIAVWKNPKGPGHVMIVVPTPEGKDGVYVTGAGATCAEECPLAASFGPHASEVEFYGHL